MIRTVLFDFDGTIFDTCVGVMKSVQFALHKMGIEEEFENLYCFMGPPLVAMFMEKYGFTSQQADEAVEYFRERYAPVGWKECTPYEGIADVIRTLRSRGYEIVVATSKPTFFANEILKYYQMEDLFDFVSGAGLNGDRTTKQEVIQHALDWSGSDASEMIMVGDRKYDVLGARSFGIDCIGVRYGFSQGDELEQCGCTMIAETPEDILTYFTG